MSGKLLAVSAVMALIVAITATAGAKEQAALPKGDASSKLAARPAIIQNADSPFRLAASSKLDGGWMIVRKGGDCKYDIPLIEVLVSGSRMTCRHHRCGNTRGSVAANGSFRVSRSYLGETITWSGNLVQKKGSWKRTGGEGKNCNGWLRVIKNDYRHIGRRVASEHHPQRFR